MSKRAEYRLCEDELRALVLKLESGKAVSLARHSYMDRLVEYGRLNGGWVYEGGQRGDGERIWVDYEKVRVTDRSDRLSSDRRNGYPAVGVRFDESFMTALMPLLRSGNPVPEIEVLGEVVDTRSLAEKLHRLLGKKLERGQAEGVVFEASFYGLSGVRWDKYGDWLDLEVLGADDIYLSESEQWLGVKRLVYYQDDEEGEFEWSGDSTIDESRVYWEIHDLVGKVTYRWDSKRNVMLGEARAWDEDQARVLVDYIQLGYRKPDELYAEGSIYPWSNIWDAINEQLSMYLGSVRESGNTKLIGWGLGQLSSEFKRDMNDWNVRWVEAPGGGFTKQGFKSQIEGGSSPTGFVQWQPVEDAEKHLRAVQYLTGWLQKQQKMPSIELSLDRPQDAKATTIQALTAPGTTFAEDRAKDVQKFWETLYHGIMNAINTFGPDCTDWSLFEPEEHAIMKKAQELKIKVKIEDIRQRPLDQIRQEFRTMAETIQLMTQGVQTLTAMNPEVDGAATFNQWVDRANWPPAVMFDRSAETMAGPGMAQPGVGPSMGVEILSQLKMSGASSELVRTLNAMNNPNLLQVLADKFMPMDEASQAIWLEEMEAAAGSGDLRALVQVISQGGA